MEILYNKIDSTLNNFHWKAKNKEGFSKFISSQMNERKKIQASEKMFDEINNLLTTEPQLLVDATRTLLIRNQNLTTLLDYVFKQHSSEDSEETGLHKKIEGISVFWEVAHLLKFGAYLISGRKVKLGHLKEQNQILKYFKAVGLDKSTIELFRKIRNANYHPFTFRNGCLINDRNEEVAKFEEIEAVYDQMNSFFTWCTITLLTNLYYNPRFFCFVFFAIKEELKQNRPLHQSYIDDFHRYNPRFKTKKNPPIIVEEKPPLLAIWITKAYHFMKNPVANSKSYFFGKIISKSLEQLLKPSINEQDIINLANKFRCKIAELGEQLILLSSNLEKEEDIQQMKKLGKRIVLRANSPFVVGDNLNEKMIELLGNKLNQKI